jgi:hypothetical protein
VPAKRYAKKSPAAARKLANELDAQLTAAITELVNSDAWPKLLASLTAKNKLEIGRYSFQNMLLLLTQCPQASAVCSFKAWVERGRAPRKGTTSLRIYAPVQFKDTDSRGNVRKTADGQEKERVGFRMIPVFDVSQTDPIWQDPCKAPMFITPSVGKPTIAKQLQGDAPAEMREDVTARIEALGYSVEYGPTGSAMGATIPSKKVVMINETVSLAQAAKTLAHELGHILADHVADLNAYKEHRGMAETVAESFAYMTSAYYGLETAQYSAPYIATWAGKDPEEVAKALQACGKQSLMMFRAFVADVESPELEMAELLTA